MRTRLIAVGAAVALACGAALGFALRPRAAPSDPRGFAVDVVRLIVSNRYAEAWVDLHPVDRRVASRREYIDCENRSRFTATFVRARVARVTDEAVGLGNGRFVRSKAVELVITLEDDGVEPFVVRHTMHVIRHGSRWTWILPWWRYADFRAGRCPTAPHAPSSSS